MNSILQCVHAKKKNKNDNVYLENWENVNIGYYNNNIFMQGFKTEKKRAQTVKTICAQ